MKKNIAFFRNFTATYENLNNVGSCGAIVPRTDFTCFTTFLPFAS